MIDELFELIVGEDGFIVTLRCDNKFDEEKYTDIKRRKSNLQKSYVSNRRVDRVLGRR